MTQPPRVDLRQIRRAVSSGQGEVSGPLKSGMSLNSADVSAGEAVRAAVLGMGSPTPMGPWSGARPSTHISTVPAPQLSHESWI